MVIAKIFKITRAASPVERLRQPFGRPRALCLVMADPPRHRIFEGVGGAGARPGHSARFARQLPLFAISVRYFN